MLKRFKSSVSCSADEIKKKLKIVADQENEVFKVEYKQKVNDWYKNEIERLHEKIKWEQAVVKRNRKINDKLYDKLKKSDERFEECKAMITKLEEEKEKLIYGKCQISVIILCSFANLSVFYVFTSLSNSWLYNIRVVQTSFSN